MAELPILSHVKQLCKAAECSICLEILNDPFETRCGHAFCKGCLNKALGSKSTMSCPLCKNSVNRRGLRKAEYLAKVVNAITAVNHAAAKDYAELVKGKSKAIVISANPQLTSTVHTSEMHEKMDETAEITPPHLTEKERVTPKQYLSRSTKKRKKPPDLLDVIDALYANKRKETDESHPLSQNISPVKTSTKAVDLGSVKITGTINNLDSTFIEVETDVLEDPFAFPISQHQLEMRKTKQKRSMRKSVKKSNRSSLCKTAKNARKCSLEIRDASEGARGSAKKVQNKKNERRSAIENVADKQMISLINDAEEHKLTIESSIQHVAKMFQPDSLSKTVILSTHDASNEVKNEGEILTLDVIAPSSSSKQKGFCKVDILNNCQTETLLPQQLIESGPAEKLPESVKAKSNLSSKGSNLKLPPKSKIKEISTVTGNSSCHKTRSKNSKVIDKTPTNTQPLNLKKISGIKKQKKDPKRMLSRLLDSGESTDSDMNGSRNNQSSDVTEGEPQTLNDKVAHWLENVDPLRKHTNEENSHKLTKSEDLEKNSDFEDLVSVSQIEFGPSVSFEKMLPMKVLEEVQQSHEIKTTEIFGEARQKYIPKSSKTDQFYLSTHIDAKIQDKVSSKRVKTTKPSKVPKIKRRQTRNTKEQNIFDLQGLSQGISPFSSPEKDASSTNCQETAVGGRKISENNLDQDEAKLTTKKSIQNEILTQSEPSLLTGELVEKNDITIHTTSCADNTSLVLSDQRYKCDKVTAFKSSCGFSNSNAAASKVFDISGDVIGDGGVDKSNHFQSMKERERETELQCSKSQQNTSSSSMSGECIEVAPGSGKIPSQNSSLTQSGDEPHQVMATVIATVYSHPKSSEDTFAKSEFFRNPRDVSSMKPTTPKQNKDNVGKYPQGAIRLEDMPIICVAETQDDSQTVVPYIVETPASSQDKNDCPAKRNIFLNCNESEKLGDEQENMIVTIANPCQSELTAGKRLDSSKEAIKQPVLLNSDDTVEDSSNKINDPKILHTCRMVLDQLRSSQGEEKSRNTNWLSNGSCTSTEDEKSGVSYKMASPLCVGRNVDVIEVSELSKEENAIKAITDVHIRLSQLEKNAHKAGSNEIYMEGTESSHIGTSKESVNSKGHRKDITVCEGNNSVVSSHYTCSSAQSLQSEVNGTHNMKASLGNLSNENQLTSADDSVIKESNATPTTAVLRKKRKGMKHRTGTSNKNVRSTQKEIKKSKKGTGVTAQKNLSQHSNSSLESLPKKRIKNTILAPNDDDDIVDIACTSNGWGETKLECVRKFSTELVLEESEQVQREQQNVMNSISTSVHFKHSMDANDNNANNMSVFSSRGHKGSRKNQHQAAPEKSVKVSSSKTKKLCKSDSVLSARLDHPLKKLSQTSESPVVICNSLKNNSCNQESARSQKRSRKSPMKRKRDASGHDKKEDKTSCNKKRTENYDCIQSLSRSSDMPKQPLCDSHVSSTWPKTYKSTTKLPSNVLASCGIVDDLSVVLHRLDGKVLSFQDEVHKSTVKLSEDGRMQLLLSQASGENIPCSPWFFAPSQSQERLQIFPNLVVSSTSSSVMKTPNKRSVASTGDRGSDTNHTASFKVGNSKNDAENEMKASDWVPYITASTEMNPKARIEKVQRLLEELKILTQDLDSRLPSKITEIEQILKEVAPSPLLGSSQSSSIKYRKHTGKRTNLIVSSSSSGSDQSLQLLSKQSLTLSDKSSQHQAYNSDINDVEVDCLPFLNSRKSKNRVLQSLRTDLNEYSKSNVSNLDLEAKDAVQKCCDERYKSSDAFDIAVDLPPALGASVEEKYRETQSQEIMENLEQRINSMTQSSQQSDIHCTNGSQDSDLIPSTFQRQRVLSSASSENDSLEKTRKIDDDNLDVKSSLKNDCLSSDDVDLFNEENDQDPVDYVDFQSGQNTTQLSQIDESHHTFDLRESSMPPSDNGICESEEEVLNHDCDQEQAFQSQPFPLEEDCNKNRSICLTTANGRPGYETDEFAVAETPPLSASQVPPPTPPPSQLPCSNAADTPSVDELLQQITELTKIGSDEQVDDDAAKVPTIVEPVPLNSKLEKQQTRKNGNTENAEIVHLEVQEAARPASDTAVARPPRQRTPLSPRPIPNKTDGSEASSRSKPPSFGESSFSNISICDDSFVRSQRKLGIMVSGLRGKGMDLIKYFTKKWGGVFYSSYVPGEITHLIVRTDQMRCDRTLKFLQGVASKIWVVSITWATQSLKQKKLLPEEKYEVLGDNNFVEEVPSFGPKKARESPPDFKLLSGFIIYCFPHFELFTYDQFVELLRLCGAEVVENARKLDQHKANKKRIIILDAEAFSSTLPNYTELSARYDATAVSCMWALECIATFRVQPLSAFPVEDFEPETL